MNQEFKGWKPEGSRPGGFPNFSVSSGEISMQSGYRLASGTQRSGDSCTSAKGGEHKMFNRRIGSPTPHAFVIAFVVIAMSTSLLAFMFTTIDIPGAIHTSALGINDQGDIVGGYSDDSGTGHGYLRHRGEAPSLPSTSRAPYS